MPLWAKAAPEGRDQLERLTFVLLLTRYASRFDEVGKKACAITLIAGGALFSASRKGFGSPHHQVLECFLSSRSEQEWPSA